MTVFPQTAPPGHGVLPSRARPAVLRFAAWCGMLATLSFAAACSGRSAASPAWDLGTEGKSVFYYLMQQEAAATGDLAAFKKSSEKLLTLDPDARVFADAAEFALRRREWAEARNIARNGLEKYPDDLQLTLVLADSYMQEGRADDALDTLTQFVKSHPGKTEPVQELARLLLLSKRHAELDHLVRGLPAGRVTPYLRFLHARSLLDRSFLEQAERELRTVVRQDPDMMDAWTNLGMCLQLRGKNAEAARLYGQALERDPENLSLWLRLVDMHVRSKRPDLALQALEDAPSSVPLQTEAGLLLLEGKYYPAARKVLTRVKNTPGAPDEVHFYLAALAMESAQNTNEALQMLEQVPPDSRLAERALRWRLQLLEEANRPDEALILARDAAAAHSDAAVYQIIYSQTLTKAGRNDQAAEILREASRKWPDNAGLTYNLAYALDSVGKKDEAFDLMESVIAVEPRNAGALNYVGYTLAEAGRDLDRAHALLQRAVAEAPDDPHIADSLAWVHYRMGSYQEAWKAIRKSISLGGDHPVIWEHYGDIAMKIGNKAEAGKGYRNALKGKPDNADAIREKMRSL